MLSRKNRSFKDVIAVLEGASFCRRLCLLTLSPDVAANIEDESTQTPDGGTVDEPPLQKAIIGQLVNYLKGQV